MLLGCPEHKFQTHNHCVILVARVIFVSAYTHLFSLDRTLNNVILSKAKSGMTISYRQEDIEDQNLFH